MKKPASPADNSAPTVREILDGTVTSTCLVEPLAPSPNSPGACGTAVLVPNGQDYYFVLIYIAGEEGGVTVSLPPVQGILVMDLPEGFFTPASDINQAIQNGTGGGPPGTVGPD
jgi:hypothetical protein